MLLVLFGNVFAGQYVRVSPDLDIYYEDAGTGTPIIFIPGWTGTTSVFKAQVEHFAQNYRAITYDPRGQGRSSKTLENNNYTQHGADLKGFINSLMLKDVVVVGHSTGCKEAFSYFQADGIENVRAFVCIDEPPKSVIEQEGDWGNFMFPGEFKAVNDGLKYDRLKFTREFIPTMVTRDMAEDEINEMADDMMKTPTHIAISLNLDGNISDYRLDAMMIDGKIPVLYVLSEREGYTAAAKAWLRKNMPNTQIEAFAYHLMFWEFPDKFNAVVDDFLLDIE
jgi:pimeloyl-ACP methyl ester carboxylesterase